MEIIDKILDKINRYGTESLSSDEWSILQSHGSKANIEDLMDWVSDESDDTFDQDGEKLPFFYFNDDEVRPFDNEKRVINIISYNLNAKPIPTNQADWGDSVVWKIKKENDENGGIYLVYDLDESAVYLIKRISDYYEGVHNDTVMNRASNVKEYKNLINKAKSMKMMNENNKSRIFEMIINEDISNDKVKFFKDKRNKIVYDLSDVQALNYFTLKDYFTDLSVFISKYYGLEYGEMYRNSFEKRFGTYQLFEITKIEDIIPHIHEYSGLNF